MSIFPRLPRFPRWRRDGGRSSATPRGIHVAITYVLDRDRRRMRARAEGLVTYADVVAHLNVGEGEGAAGYDALFDATGATTDLTADQVRALALRARALR